MSPDETIAYLRETDHYLVRVAWWNELLVRHKKLPESYRKMWGSDGPKRMAESDMLEMAKARLAFKQKDVVPPTAEEKAAFKARKRRQKAKKRKAQEEGRGVTE